MSEKMHQPRILRPKSDPVAVAVDDSPAVLLLAANKRRMSASLVNAGPDTVYVGNSADVTAADGIPIPVNSSVNDKSSTDAWYGICASGETADVRVIEV